MREDNVGVLRGAPSLALEETAYLRMDGRALT
jgi:hypothetical protein